MSYNFKLLPIKFNIILLCLPLFCSVLVGMLNIRPKQRTCDPDCNATNVKQNSRVFLHVSLTFRHFPQSLFLIEAARMRKRFSTVSLRNYTSHLPKKVFHHTNRTAVDHTLFLNRLPDTIHRQCPIPTKHHGKRPSYVPDALQTATHALFVTTQLKHHCRDLMTDLY